MHYVFIKWNWRFGPGRNLDSIYCTAKLHVFCLDRLYSTISAIISATKPLIHNLKLQASNDWTRKHKNYNRHPSCNLCYELVINWYVTTGVCHSMKLSYYTSSNTHTLLMFIGILYNSAVVQIDNALERLQVWTRTSRNHWSLKTIGFLLPIPKLDMHTLLHKVYTN